MSKIRVHKRKKRERYTPYEQKKRQEDRQLSKTKYREERKIRIRPPQPFFCPQCGNLMTRRRSYFQNGWWWGCVSFPVCTVTAAEHADGTLMSLPADADTKTLRTVAHRLCEKIWGEWHSIECKKLEQYEWLSKHTSTGHIGYLEREELECLVEKLREKIGGSIWV